MFSRIFLSTALFAVFAVPASAQSTDVAQMVARMQSIIAEMELLQKEFSTLAASLGTSAGTPSVLGAQTSAPEESAFTESLAYGETNDDIKRVQKLLATDPEIYPYGVASGFFGPKTQEAIRNLQSRFGLDPVGVIGPATTALLSGYMRNYPDENYPDGVLTSKPRVLGASTSQSGSDSASTLTALQNQLNSLTSSESGAVEQSTSGSNGLKITADFDDDGSVMINVRFADGTINRFKTEVDDEEEAVEYIADQTDLSESEVEAVIVFTGEPSGGGDEEDAEDALDDADDAIDHAKDEIREAEEDGDDVEWAEDTLDSAKDLLDEAEEAYDDEDYEDAIELAEEAEDLADEAIDRIDEEREVDADDIDEIIAYLGNNESIVVVLYDDNSDDEFEIDTDDEDDVIEEVADELDIDEDDVEDLIEFRGKKVKEIVADIDDGEATIEIEYEDGGDRVYTIDEDDKDEIIERLSDSLNLPKSEVKDLIEFD